jgi:hypothetical protein
MAPIRNGNEKSPSSTTHRRKKKSNIKTDTLPFKRSSKPKKHKINPIKTRIRDVQRLLAHETEMQADVRVNLERELASLEQELRTERAAIRRSQLIRTYHMVRFFGIDLP